MIFAFGGVGVVVFLTFAPANGGGGGGRDFGLIRSNFFFGEIGFRKTSVGGAVGDFLISFGDFLVGIFWGGGGDAFSVDLTFVGGGGDALTLVGGGGDAFTGAFFTGNVDLVGIFWVGGGESLTLVTYDAVTGGGGAITFFCVDSTGALFASTGALFALTGALFVCGLFLVKGLNLLRSSSLQKSNSPSFGESE